MKKILLFEPDKEQAGLFAGWLKEEGYEAALAHEPQEVSALSCEARFDILLMDVDPPAPTEAVFALCQTIKNDLRTQDLPIITLTYRNDTEKIIKAIEAGTDSFVLKPFETDSFLKHLETIFKEIELKKQGKKLLDLNYINFLIKLGDERPREDFFLLASVMFNKLIIDKVSGILGEPIIMQLIKRANELIGEDYVFMRAVEFSNNRLLMDGVDRASKDVPVGRLATAFRDYVYAFLHLVQMLTSDILMERQFSTPSEERGG